jgi:3-hydroxybutyryl-CoA dehydrogenase
MGTGIAFVSAVRAKVPVLLYDTSPTQLSHSHSFLSALLSKDVSKGRITPTEAAEAKDRIRSVDTLAALRDVDMAVEAVSEQVELKKRVFRGLRETVNEGAILATNTSSISITKIAGAVVPEGVSAASEEGRRAASRVVGLHFFNPVPVMKLVELISAVQTSKETLDRARAFAEACGKEVTTSQDVPGFVSNALLMPFINEAIMCLEKGIATRDDIDKTFRLGMAHPMGPLQLADFIGLDTCLSIQQTLYTGTSDSKYRPSVLLERMVDAQWLGRKSGRGFYEYNDD